MENARLDLAAVRSCSLEPEVEAVGPAQAKPTFAFLRDSRSAKGAVPLDQAQFRYAFANAVPEAESAEPFERWTIPAPMTSAD
ncbi:hypothetical protein ACIQCR_33395 [Streptomyces sp. NPDC093249]|uniref:hypothetical protein n=1 Tax=unclassified Streptomyces TaxID=2593676 RepID=UPI00380C4038